MARFTIIAADNIKGGGLELLQKEFGANAVVARGAFKSGDELAAALKDCDALLVRSGTTVAAEALRAAGPRLKLVGRAGVGTDNIDKAAATERGVIVMNTPFGNTISAAEQAIALLFATARNTARADRLMHEHRWEKKSLVGAEVHGKTLGVIGLGRIGQHVAKVMKAAGMTITAYDPFLTDSRAAELGIERLELDELLAGADFVSLHTPLTDETRNLLSAGRLARMKPGARLVNCARGGIVDETALAEAVREGRLAAAGVDVFSREPLTEGPLFEVADITLTPHLGASTEEAEERCGRQLAEQVIAYFRDGRIINAVNLNVAVDPEMKPWADLAEKLARVAATIMGAPADEIEVRPGGALAGKDTGALTIAAVCGVLAAAGIEDVNLINALTLSRQRGLAVNSVQVGGEAASEHMSRLDVVLRGGGKSTRLAGVVGADGRPRLTRVDDADMDIPLARHMLFLRYPDQPGWIGAVGSLTAKYGLNIDFLQVGALISRQRASMAVSLAEAAPAALLEELRGLRVGERQMERVNSVNFAG